MNTSTKDSRRIRNWSEYNASLCNRGSLTVWVEESALQQWYNHERSGNRGASNTYSDVAIEMMLMLKSLYRLKLRQVTGFVGSIFSLMHLELNVPDYSTLSRRQSTLDVFLEPSVGAGALHVVMDSSGLKIYGEGEWSVRRHGASKRRKWRKLHLAIDQQSMQILSATLTDQDEHDVTEFDDLLDQIEQEISQVSADGAYDSWAVYEKLAERSASGAIPPRRGSKIRRHGNSSDPPLERDEHLRFIRKHGRAAWKKEVGYHFRSLAETMMGRYKQIFGQSLQARKWVNQVTEALLNCALLNRLTDLGRPLRELPA